MPRVFMLLVGLAVLAAPAFADEASAIGALRQNRYIVDAQPDGKGNLFVVVKPERLPWNQFADQVCEVVRPHKARIFRVRVLAVTSLSPSKPLSAIDPLAQANCGR